MTCIVGRVWRDRVFIGSDSCSSDGYCNRIARTEKVFRINNDILIGLTGSWRDNQLIRHYVQVPRREPSESIEAYLVTKLMDAIRTCLKDHGSALVTDNTEFSSSPMIIGYAGQLFVSACDYQVISNDSAFAAVGAGGSFALGALETLSLMSNDDDELTFNDIKQQMRTALCVASKFSPFVLPPFRILSVQRRETT